MRTVGYKILGLFGVLLITGCGSNAPEHHKKYNNTFPYQANSPYKNELKYCATLTSYRHGCSLKRLPYIGISSPSPSNQDIQNRLLVSHQWMGDRFVEVLSKLPNDIKLLLRSVTTIVIDDSIRPSYYWTGTGAIYLDPAMLWTTNEEKATIAKDDDVRLSYGSDLSLKFLWRYVSDNQYAYQSYSLEGDEERSIEALTIPLARLLYHELAHANDFLPADLLPQLNLESTPDQAVSGLRQHWYSNQLYRHSPLRDEGLKSLAKVLYQGKASSEDETATKPDTAGAWMANEGAKHFYAYSNQYEDVATLFEATMMKYHYDIDMDIAFTDQPERADSPCSEYLVGWGIRNRLADPLVKTRALAVVSQILRDVDWQTFFQEKVGEPQRLINNKDWCTNLVLDASPQASQALSKGKSISDQPIRSEDWLPLHY